ncbi:hypothetical protein HPB51_013535 [Rhipicephalus microplus]|uniref:Nuclear pore complex protein n=1 Tax=Rhipicephalus microplus TaxID=6941 RepID=A0A9J6EA95_RHIMP|nr:hypothetical protein HPB51_013535 [Rhipicephalus microplus]
MEGSMADFATPGSGRTSRDTGNVSANFAAADMTAFSTLVLTTEHPAVIATAGIYANFSEAYKVHNDSQDVLTLIEKYASLCDSYLTKVREVTECIVSRKGEPVWMEAMACHILLTDERNTWKLMSVLLRDRLKAEVLTEEGGNNTILLDRALEASDRIIVEASTARNSFARQVQLVVDWLESCAAHQCCIGYGDGMLEYFAEGRCTWKNTLQHVQSCADVSKAPSSDVTELDPDASSREQLLTRDLDRDEKCHLFHSVFFHRRAGKLQRAQKLAADNGHFWLAAALGGWKPYLGLNNGSIMGAVSTQLVDGNFYRDLWKCACRESATNTRCSLYERAVYGALSGNLQAMLPACTTWEDKPWARMRAVIDVCLEQELQTGMQQATNLEPLPPGCPSEHETFEAVFRDLQTAAGVSESRDQEIKHILQRGLVLNDAVSMVEEILEWVTAQVIEPPLLTMRFLAHMVLLLRQVGCETATGACSALVRTYLDMLIEDGHGPLVAPYAATQPAAEQAAMYKKLAKPQN